MALFDFISGEFINVIEWVDDSHDIMVWRFDARGHAINYGAKLTVREGQAAVFVNEGQIADVFSPGLWMLETNNMPVLTTLKHWDHGFKSPFKTDVCFVSTTRFNDRKWGTKNPIIARDPEFGPVRLRAYGTYSMRVTDPARFLTEIVGTDGEFTTDEISFQIRNVIVQEFSRAIATSGIPVLDMAANTGQLGGLIAKAIAPTIEQYGLSLPEFYIENISLPDAVEKVLDKRTSMGILGDLNRFGQFAAGEAMLRAADQPGGAGAGIGAGIGAGLGSAIGAGMAGMAGRSGPWGAVPGAAPQQATPPAQPAVPPVANPAAAPPPGVAAAPEAAGTAWHVAIDGQAAGPFGRADLERLGREGKLGPQTLVWAPGRADWTPAGEVADLAPVLGATPPPLPPPLPGGDVG